MRTTWRDYEADPVWFRGLAFTALRLPPAEPERVRWFVRARGFCRCDSVGDPPATQLPQDCNAILRCDIQRAAHAKAGSVEDMSVNHCRAHVLVAEKLLHRADVVAVLQQVRCEAVAQRVTARRLRHARRTDRFPHRLLEQAFIEMVPPFQWRALAPHRSRIERKARRRAAGRQTVPFVRHVRRARHCRRARVLRRAQSQRICR